MAVQSNNSDEAVVGSYSLYAGIATVSVLAVNPSKDELAKIGINVQNEPEYTVSFSDDTFNKIVFWVKSEEPDFTSRIEILVQPKMRTSKDGGKSMWVNNIGQITWSDQVPGYDWWKNPDKSRKAYVGEDTLINLLKAWANVANGGEVSIDTPTKVFAGDVSELKGYVEHLKENRFRVLFGVKDEKYQVAYTKHFGRLKPVRDDLFIKELNDEYGSFKAWYPKNLQLIAFKPELVAPDPENYEVTEEAGPVTAAETNAADNLPF